MLKEAVKVVCCTCGLHQYYECMIDDSELVEMLRKEGWFVIAVAADKRYEIVCRGCRIDSMTNNVCSGFEE